MASYRKTAAKIWQFSVPWNVAEDLRIAFLQSNLFWQVSYARSKTKGCTEISTRSKYSVPDLFCKFRWIFFEFMLKVYSSDPVAINTLLVWEAGDWPLDPSGDIFDIGHLSLQRSLLSDLHVGPSPKMRKIKIFLYYNLQITNHNCSRHYIL